MLRRILLPLVGASTTIAVLSSALAVLHLSTPVCQAAPNDDDKQPAKPKEPAPDPFNKGAHWKGELGSLIRNNQSGVVCHVTVTESGAKEVKLRLKCDDGVVWSLTAHRDGAKLNVTEIDVVGEKGVSIRNVSGLAEANGKKLVVQVSGSRYGPRIKNQPVQSRFEGEVAAAEPDHESRSKRHHKRP